MKLNTIIFQNEGRERWKQGGEGRRNGEREATIPHSLTEMKPICVPKLGPSRTWEKNLSGWQDVQRLRSWFWSWIFCGRIPPRSRRILRIKIFPKTESLLYQQTKQYGKSIDISVKELWERSAWNNASCHSVTEQGHNRKW